MGNLQCYSIIRHESRPKTGNSGLARFVVWGTWNNRLLEHLLPKYVDAFPELHSGFGKARDGFCSQLAGIAAFGKADSIESGWLIEFVRVVTEAERVRWAATFGQVLSGMEEASKDALWKRWLDRYWRDRVEGIPVQVTESEGEMTEWSISLRIAFPRLSTESSEPLFPTLMG